ncbi:MAG: hypothetical protein R3300_21090 [Candidatus Promineifilaceae bacterium]|nr:hypothetical protein [Candidatus Promineifilaceae bacterium]
MNVRNLLTVNAVLLGLVALVELLAPTIFAQASGLEPTQAVINLERTFGAFALGPAITSWLMRSAAPGRARRAFLLGSGVAYLVFAVVIVINMAALTGLGQFSPSWLFAAVDALLGLAFLYFGLKERV